MWTRKQLKLRAKDILRNNYITCFLYSLSLFIAVNGINGSNFYHYRDTQSYELIYILGLFKELLMIMLIGFIITTGLRILVGYAIEVSSQRYFIRVCKGLERDATPLLFGFMTEYKNILYTMFLRSLYIMLWSLLLIIPGIIKRYTYRFVPYILAEAPQTKPANALRISSELTAGHKWEMFLLDLSFIGWYILGSFALGFGIFLVNPYRDTTFAELYINLTELNTKKENPN